ncbi:MAG TPA: lysozyme inhibitor LprI family protein [Azospirillum sp.]
MRYWIMGKGRRNRSAVAVFCGALALLATGAARSAPSFDCKAVGTPVEKAICADPKLAAADQELADAYKHLVGLLDAGAKDTLRAEQRAWLGQRNQCTGAPNLGACLADTLHARWQALIAATPAAVAGVARIVDGIPADPQGATRRLADVRGPLGKGWTAYLLRYGPAPDRVKATVALREAVAGIDDEYPREIAEAADLATDEGFLTALRIIADHHEMAWPCFVMERQGRAAWTAQGALYGSSRDGFGRLPECPEDGALLGTPHWKAVEDMLEPMLGAAFSRTGTMRSGISRQMAIDHMMSAVDPRLFVGDGPALGATLDAVAGWKNPRWVGSDWAPRFRAAVETAVDGWMPVLAARYRIGQPEARRVAEAVAAAALASRTGFITEYVVFDRDTRLPDWLRGTWTWSGGAEGTPFATPSGRAAIDAAAICVGTECEGFDVTQDGDGVEVDAKEMKATGVTPAPDAKRRAVELASAGSNMMVRAIPLADGGVLVSGYDKPVVLRRVAK